MRDRNQRFLPTMSGALRLEMRKRYREMTYHHISWNGCRTVEIQQGNDSVEFSTEPKFRSYRGTFFQDGEKVDLGRHRCGNEDQQFKLVRNYRTGQVTIIADITTWGCNGQPWPFVDKDGKRSTSVELTEVRKQYPTLRVVGASHKCDLDPFAVGGDGYTGYYADVKQYVDRAMLVARELGWYPGPIETLPCEPVDYVDHRGNAPWYATWRECDVLAQMAAAEVKVCHQHQVDLYSKDWREQLDRIDPDWRKTATALAEAACDKIVAGIGGGVS